MSGVFRIVFAAVALCAALAAATPRADAGDGKVVVELYTSQGCSSCPPADAYLAELAQRDDVIALSFHVDYWNYIGWTDPFSTHEATLRQRAYGRALHRSYVYTPQAVIDGWAETVGSNRAQVAQLIRMAAEKLDKIPVDVARLADGRVRLRLPDRPDAAGAAADIWLGFYDTLHTTAVRAGENRGATIRNANVVRSFRRLGAWTGKALERTLDPAALGAAGRDRGVVLVQTAGNGPILGAATFPLAAR